MADKSSDVGRRRKASGSVRKRQTISMETKVSIIKNLDSGERMANVARAFGLNRSTVSTIYRCKDRIMEHVESSVPMTSTIISKKRNKCVEKMEKLLGIWLNIMNQRGIPLSFPLIQEKAKSLFHDLKVKEARENNCVDETFTASYGWFARFKQRANLHNLELSNEASRVNRRNMAEEYPNSLMHGGNASNDMKPLLAYNAAAYHQAVNNFAPDSSWQCLTQQYYNDLPRQGRVEEGRNMRGGDAGYEDFFDLQSDGLTNEDLIGLEEMQRRRVIQELPTKRFETNLLAAAFSKFEEGLMMLEGQDPNIERFFRTSTAIRNALQCYRTIYDEKRKKARQ